MSYGHKIGLLFLAALVISMVSMPSLGEENYSVNLAADKFLGDYLVNQSGFTLYYFSDDSEANGGSSCYDDCASIWRPFFAGDILVPNTLNSADFSTITRSDGSSQTTFKGWPLYLYSRDREAGDAFGNGREDGLWQVVNPLEQPQLI